MKKVGRIHRGLTLLAFVSILTLSLWIFLPQDELYASGSNEEEAETTEQTDGEADATEETEGASEGTDGTAGASADATAGASEQKFEHYEPLPVEPIHREANNGLLGGGLVVAALTIGGAFAMDKRNGR